jgi:hypothetical protein
MAHKRPKTEEPVPEVKPEDSVKKLEPDELERGLVVMGYEKKAFEKQRVTRLRKFTGYICKAVKLTWSDLIDLDDVMRAASIGGTEYPAPHGATRYFQVLTRVNLSSDLCCVSVFVLAERRSGGCGQGKRQR